MLYKSKTCPVKEDVIRSDRNDAKVIRWICNFRPEDSISAEELRATLKLNSMKEYLLNTKLLCLGI